MIKEVHSVAPASGVLRALRNAPRKVLLPRPSAGECRFKHHEELSCAAILSMIIQEQNKFLHLNEGLICGAVITLSRKFLVAE